MHYLILPGESYATFLSVSRSLPLHAVCTCNLKLGILFLWPYIKRLLEIITEIFTDKDNLYHF